MGTKNKPGRFDCFANAEPDEPMFVLLARDQQAPILVECWAHTRAESGEDPAKVEEALKCAKAMRRWRYERKGAPICEYCESGSEDCTKASRKLVSDDGGFVWLFWCAGPETYLPRECTVVTIEEYFATDEISNDYCNDEALRVYHETKGMRVRANDAVMGEGEDAHVDDPEELPDYGGGISGG